MNAPKNPSQTGRLDSVLPVLANTERQTILSHLREPTGDTVSLEELTKVLATDTGLDRDQAQIRLHHAHLPKLADLDIVDYDVDSNTVQYLGSPEVESVLDSIHDVGVCS